MAKKIKAIGMLSGGLDSSIAAKLILDQGIDVIALNFKSPFCLCDQKGKCYSAIIAAQLKIPLKTVFKGEDYIRLLQNPKHGYGSGMNPCIDCRIFALKKARKFAKQAGAKFIFTGEVLGQRPMSQRSDALRLIEKEAGLKGKLLRPLSAKLLPETEAEKKGWIRRENLLAINGRGRKRQFELAKSLNVNDYPCPSGGCLLTYKEFAAKVRDLFSHRKKATLIDIELLKIGRHFRFGENKIIAGRDEKENKNLLALVQKKELVFEVPKTGSPIVLLQGKKTKQAVEKAASIALRYSDCTNDSAPVEYWQGKSKKKNRVLVQKISEEELLKIRI
ncbi:MAG: hypothetical protein PHH08_00435 [Candidatus ainarchaeum sp.]|nr:hypothetical protein [Candidatus ainarchaeum sp.]